MADPAALYHHIVDYLQKSSPVLLLILGGLLTQLWARFRTRTRRFTWNATHNQVAVAGSHPLLGVITVQHNGNPVNHVHATTVEFLNDSNEDQKDVVVTIAYGGVGHIVNSHGIVSGSLTTIPFEPGYMALYNNATPELINQLNTFVTHTIPVLNRHQKAAFTLWVVRDDSSAPQVQVSCNHPGYRLDFVPLGTPANKRRPISVGCVCRRDCLGTRGVIVGRLLYSTAPLFCSNVLMVFGPHLNPDRRGGREILGSVFTVDKLGHEVL